MSALRAAWLAIGLWLATDAQATESPEAQAERQQIKIERAAANASLKRAEAECRQRFVVSSCVNEAQAQHREAMSALRMRELTLDEAKRKAEAEANERRIEAKRAEAASRPAPVPRAASAPKASAAASAASSPAAGTRVRKPSKTGDDAAEAAARVAAQQRRAVEAAAHRQEVEQRNAERAARGKKSTPLPVPSAASVAEIASAPVR
jgi:colicin import membrane protein